MSLLKNTTLLRYLAQHNPRLWEIIHPHEPAISENMQQLLAATIVKNIAKQVADPAASKELTRLGKTLFDAGVKTLTYENAEWPGGVEVMINPQPEPPGKPEYYGALLSIVADAIPSPALKSTADRIRTIGASLK